jgi:myo-inositol-1-phosphate synthase
MMEKIKIAIVGIGNCASSLIQGLFYYKNVKDERELVPGLMHNVLGGYRISDIKVVAAFDIDARKVGKDVSGAIFAPPNCTKVFCKNVPKIGVKVKMGPVLDGVAPHMKEYPEDKTFVVAKRKPVDVVKELKKSRAEILINYCPVGSQKAVEYYANCALKAGCAFINCMPVFIASDKKWAEKFEKKNLPVIGDDIKSQVGATIVHRTLAHLFAQRGVIIDRSYQLNFGGNSVTGDQNILLRVNGEIKYTPIGEFIDNLIKKYKVKRKGDGKEIVTKDSLLEKVECFTIDDDFKVRLVPVEAFIRHKIAEPLYEIETEGGRKIKITKDHNVFILNEKGKLEPIPVKDLKENKSLIAVPENLFFPQKEKRFLNLKNYLENILGHSSYRRGKIKIKNNFLKIVGFPKIKIPIKFPLSDEFLQIVGLWLADGSYDRKEESPNIELACANDKDCLNIILNFCKNFHFTYKIVGKKKVRIRINSKTLGRIFKEVFELKGNVYRKRIPSWIFNLSNRQIAQVLKGYISGDGGDVGKQIRWSSVSEGLIRDIQTLFLRIGINSTIFKEEYKKNHTKKAYPSKLGYCWHGLITGYRNFKNFTEKVGFIQKEKEKKALRILKEEKKESLKEKLIPNLPILRNKWKIKSTTWWRCPQISAKVVLAQLNKINPDEDFKRNIYNVCTGETKFLKVKSIREIKIKKEEYVYDLSIKPYERFICSNILVHNTDFLNMLAKGRLKSKKISKTESVESQLAKRLSYENLHIGPSDWVPWLKDNKICFIRIEGRKFGNVPIELELRLSVEDSPNSAGCVIDAIRLAKIALDRKIGGPLISASAYLMKSPPQQFTDEKAREMVEEFIKNQRER